MTIPVYVLGAICLVTNCYWSDRLQRRAPFLVGCAFPVFIGYLMCVGSSNKHVGLAGMFILVMGKQVLLILYLLRTKTNNLIRRLHHFYTSRCLDCYQCLPRWQTCSSYAFCILDCKLVLTSFSTAVSKLPRSPLQAR
jgi:hypothetical protein